jgi:hypothetical protein
MDETFYTVLGVEADADAEAIRRAYRDLVKEHHPDVSDDPTAAERFRRLTTARDVLVDAAERERYDRIGHETYVDRHVESSAWGTDAGVRRDGPAASDRTSTPDRAGESDRAAWLGADAEPGRSRAGERAQRRRERRHVGRPTGATGAGDGGYGVREGPGTGGTGPGPAGRLLRGAGRLGPWLFVHAIFVLSAVATGWLVYTQAGRHPGLAVPAVVVATLLVGMAVLVSALHVVSQVYS